MATVEERLAYLEGKVEEHSRGMDDVLQGLAHLDQRLMHLEEGMGRRFEAMDRRFDVLDTKIDQRTDALDQKISRQFVWLVSMQLTTLVTMIAAFATLVAAIIDR